MRIKPTVLGSANAIPVVLTDGTRDAVTLGSKLNGMGVSTPNPDRVTISYVSDVVLPGPHDWMLGNPVAGLSLPLSQIHPGVFGLPSHTADMQRLSLGGGGAAETKIKEAGDVLPTSPANGELSQLKGEIVDLLTKIFTSAMDLNMFLSVPRGSFLELSQISTLAFVENLVETLSLPETISVLNKAKTDIPGRAAEIETLLRKIQHADSHAFAKAPLIKHKKPVINRVPKSLKDDLLNLFQRLGDLHSNINPIPSLVDSELRKKLPSLLAPSTHYFNELLDYLDTESAIRLLQRLKVQYPHTAEEISGLLANMTTNQAGERKRSL